MSRSESNRQKSALNVLLSHLALKFINTCHDSIHIIASVTSVRKEDHRHIIKTWSLLYKLLKILEHTDEVS